MDNKEYVDKKAEYSYNLYKNNQFFKKARAIVIKDNELLVIKVKYNNGNIHYLLPGGGVDCGETIKEAVVRETLEEYNINVIPVKYLGKQYYTIQMQYAGKDFPSNRIEYFYICEYVSSNLEDCFGVEGEFQKDDRSYERTKLSLSDLKRIKHKDLNDMDEKNFNKLLDYMENISK